MSKIRLIYEDEKFQILELTESGSYSVPDNRLIFQNETFTFRQNFTWIAVVDEVQYASYSDKILEKLKMTKHEWIQFVSQHNLLPHYQVIYNTSL